MFRRHGTACAGLQIRRGQPDHLVAQALGEGRLLQVFQRHAAGLSDDAVDARPGRATRRDRRSRCPARSSAAGCAGPGWTSRHRSGVVHRHQLGMVEGAMRAPDAAAGAHHLIQLGGHGVVDQPQVVLAGNHDVHHHAAPLPWPARRSGSGGQRADQGLVRQEVGRLDAHGAGPPARQQHVVRAAQRAVGAEGTQRTGIEPAGAASGSNQGRCGSDSCVVKFQSCANTDISCVTMGPSRRKCVSALVSAPDSAVTKRARTFMPVSPPARPPPVSCGGCAGWRACSTPSGLVMKRATGTPPRASMRTMGGRE